MKAFNRIDYLHGVKLDDVFFESAVLDQQLFKLSTLHKLHDKEDDVFVSKTVIHFD